MSVQTIFPFTDSLNYTPEAGAEVSGGSGRLVLQSDPGKLFNQDFSSDIGFTYNALNTEFIGGLARQIQKAYRPTYYLGRIFADFTSSFDANYSEGSVVATQIGTPVLNAGKLECLGGGNNAIYWQNSPIGGCSTKLSIKLKYTPNYSGAPAANVNIIEINDGASNVNKLVFFHATAGGTLRATAYNSAGGAHFSATVIGAAFNPIAGTTYEILFEIDSINGRLYGFLDGTLLANVNVGAFARTNTATRLRIGSGTVYASANARFDDVCLYNGILETLTYIPSAYGIADPKQPTFYASYDEDINGDWGDGVLTGAATGGAAVSAGKLDLKYNDIRYVDYASAGNSTGLQAGCIRLKYTPNYAGSPATSMILINLLETIGSNNNRITIFHNLSGDLQTNIWDNVGATIASIVWGAWAPVLGTEYEIEFNWDITTGATRIFIDGVQFGVTDTNTGTLIAHNIIRVGSNHIGSVSSNFSINDIIIFAYPQHTVDYTPNWSGIRPFEYDGDTITMPSFIYSSVGNIQAFTNIIATILNAPRFILNDLYFSGSWLASAGTWATANDLATVLANIATFPASDAVTIKIITQGNIGSQQSIDDLTLTYTGQIYPITNPKILCNQQILHQGLIDFIPSVTVTGLDEVRYILSNQGVLYYYNGATWAVSDGTFAQASTLAQIQTGMATFTVVTITMQVYIVLHSDDGSSAPTIENLEVDTDYAGETPTTVEKCIVWGYQLDSEGNGVTTPFTVSLLQKFVEYGTVNIVRTSITVTPESSGYWEIEIAENETMGTGYKYKFDFGTYGKYYVTVPKVAAINFNELI